jgi:DNA-binding transcriptional LysR family regulator
VRFGHPRPSTLIAGKLLDSRIHTVASHAYLKRHGHPKDPRELADAGHVCIQFRNPETGRPFPWEFHKKRKTLVFDLSRLLTVNDVGTLCSVCLAGLGMAQVFDLGVGPMLSGGRLVNVFPDWPDERFPLYALHPSRRHLPPKTRAFLDFIVELLRLGAKAH